MTVPTPFLRSLMAVSGRPRTLLGLPGTPPARHDDLAARSIAVRIRRKCRKWKRGPRPKIATVERREASVPRHGTRRTPLGADLSRLTNATTEIVRLSALRPPLHSGMEAITRTPPGRKNAPRE